MLYCDERSMIKIQMENNSQGTKELPKPNIRVVLADDEPLIIMNLKEILASNNFEVLGTAADGFEAINICSIYKPDVVLMDVHMPSLDGLKAAEYIYKSGYAETIVMITAYGEDTFVEKAAEIGVAGYLVKPVNAKSLMPAINIAMARSKELCHLRSEVQEAYKNIEARKKIERAKSYLIQQNNYSEKESFDFIRQASKDHNMSMESIAEIVLLGEKNK